MACDGSVVEVLEVRFMEANNCRGFMSDIVKFVCVGNCQRGEGAHLWIMVVCW